MNKKIKMLKKLIERMEFHQDRAHDEFTNGYNQGINTSIDLLNKKIKCIEEAED
jgi:uncharacterized protein (DUF2164 family)